MTLARTLQGFAALLVLTTAVSAQIWPPTNSHGPSPGLGHSTAVIGDVDGDGFDDLLVGEPGDHITPAPYIGKATVYSGASGTVVHTLTGPANTRFGSTVCALGDLDGDGVRDFAVGQGQLQVDSVAFVTGAVYAYSGATASILWSVSGPDFLYVSLAGTDDVDGDGRGDVLIGRPSGSPGGRADLLSGASGAVIRSWVGATGESLGDAVAAIDDLDGDQIGDLAIGRPWANPVPGGTNLYSGAVDLVSSANGAVIRTVSDPSASFYGKAVARIRDLDGDGIDDLVVGAPGAASIISLGNGTVHVVSAATGATIHRIVPADALPGLGGVIAAADFDLDGTDDIVFASPNRDLQTGRVYVYSGATGLQEAVIDGTHIQSGYGYRLAAGDLNGDGLSELVISEQFAGGVFAGLGGRVTIHGAPAPHVPAGMATISVNQLAVSSSTTQFARRGLAVTSAGDVDGDGVDDVVIAEPGIHIYPPAFAGRVEVLSGADGTTIHNHVGAVGEDYGSVVANVGDLDGDSVPDLGIGVRAEVTTAGATPRVEVRSGGPGHSLFSLPLTSTPLSMCGPGDLDGAGGDDFVLGEVDASSGVGAVTAYDSVGAVLWSVAGQSGDGLGESVVVLDDMNGDGVADIAASATQAAGGFGEIRILSGATGASITTIPGPGAFSTFGRDMDTIEDLDGDGKRDLLVGVPTFLVFGGLPRVEARSSATGAVLYSLSDPSGAGAFGTHLTALDDIDGDGISEFAAASGTKVAVFSGATGAFATFVDLSGAAQASPTAMASAGDLNGDGVSDLVVGAGSESPGNVPYAGSAYHIDLDPIVVSPIQGGIPVSGGVLDAAAAGNVGIGEGGPYAVLAVNRDAGGFDRVVDVGIGESILFEFRQAPSVAAPQRFAIFGLIGIPQSSDRIVIPTVGTLLFPPSPAAPGLPWLFTLAESYLQPSIGFLPAAPGDWSFLVPNGLPFATEFTLQAICQVNTPGGTGVSNALVVDVE